MSRRARERQNARPWEMGEDLGPDDEQDTGDWSDGTGEGDYENQDQQ